MCLAMVLNSLTLFSFAADGEELKDSGSPEVSMMAMIAIAAEDGISLAAAEGNSGQFGYNIESYFFDGEVTLFERTTNFNLGYQGYLPAGTYSVTLNFTNVPYRLGVWNQSNQTDIINPFAVSTSSPSVTFTLSETTLVSVYGVFNKSDFLPSDVSLLSVESFLLVPVEGISSGYTFNSGVHDDDDISARLEYVDWEFGNQPAGNYIINIYTYGQNYDVDFDIAVGGDVTSDRKLAVVKSHGLYTCLVSHGGGDLTLSANFTYTKDVLNSVAERYAEGVAGVVYNVSSGNWIFNITDVVAVPLESAGLEQFGVFGSIVGFFRDQFSSMKSFIAAQIDKLAGDDETKSDVDDAQSELEKEVEDLNNLSGQLDTQASNLEQQFTTDFAIPDTVSGQGANFQSIYTSLFGSLGVFGIFIWLPIVMAVIKKLLRL